MKLKKIKPMVNKILTTANRYEEADMKGGIITKIEGTLKEYQTVIAVGPLVRDIKKDDVVMINPARYIVKKHKEGSIKDGIIGDNPVIGYNFNMVEVDGKDCLSLYDSDIDYIIEDMEDEPTSSIVLPKYKLEV